MRDRSGFALVLVLVVIALLATAALEMSREVKTSAALAANFQARTKAKFKALDGLSLAVETLLYDDEGYDGLDETWATLAVEGEESGVEVHMADLSGRINLNQCFNEQGDLQTDWADTVGRLFELLGRDSALAQAVLDWIDPDTLPRMGGAEAEDYREAGLDYGPRNDPMLSLKELDLILSFDQALLKGDKEKPGLLELVSVQGGDKININTAPDLVLLALDDEMSEIMVDEIITLREAGGIRDLSVLKNLTGMTETLYKQLQSMLTVSSKWFQVDALGEEGRARYKLRLTLARVEGQVMIASAEVGP